MIWIRISIHDGLAPNALPASPTIVYIIWFTNSDYLLTGTIKNEWKDFIMEVWTGRFFFKKIIQWRVTKCAKGPRHFSVSQIQEHLAHSFSIGDFAALQGGRNWRVAIDRDISYVPVRAVVAKGFARCAEHLSTWPTGQQPSLSVDKEAETCRWEQTIVVLWAKWLDDFLSIIYIGFTHTNIFFL